MNTDDVGSQFVFPQLCVITCAVLGASMPGLAVLVLIPLLVEPRWMLLNWFGIAMINFGYSFHDVSWAGLIPTLYTTIVVGYRLGSFRRTLTQFLAGRSVEILCLLTIAISFFFISRSQYFVRTAIKSSIQLVSIIAAALTIRRIDRRWLEVFRQQIFKIVPKYLVGYFVITVVNWRLTTPELRYGGLLGAQLLAFAVTMLFAVYWLCNQRSRALLCLGLLALSGSRTYMGAAALVVFIPVVARRMDGVRRLAAIIGLIVFVIAVAMVLPMISSRFATNDEFLGTFLGRFLNYEAAIDYIHASPVFGDGMGSFLKVLEGWLPEYFEIYYVSGDTTVMHNEYLRIVMETGFIGGALAGILLWRAFAVRSAEVRACVLVFALGSLTENTLSMYSTAMVVLLLLAFAFRPADSKPA